ncbi:glycosyltransferase family A protein [Flavobacterium sp. UMI-01]|uniref:glycosyltransferase family 2 protein n=1 Tax=Flavobacterium sp. UMI-01 TaxID=1441053 RepID=UPI001C7D7849|nr:glycosyltransferase family A protein [Flavobacterium sp. UMI-01]GIZ10058.1 N-acetylgalactosaminyl-diphosphoundecaprenol glucuronosyltransferase [Flavobacterium sp. UMI-01]
MINPLISVIVPAYNAAEFLQETLESVKQQTYSNWEIILVNDCSTDATLQKANEFSQGVSNVVKVITNEKNSGVSVSRNVAVANASGSWLALLDSDDVWLPNHLETLVATITQDATIKMAYAGCLVFLDKVENIIFKQEISVAMLQDFNVSLFTHQIGINPCTAIIEKKTWESVGGMIQEVHPAEDKELFFRIARTGNKIAYSGHHTALYRKHSSGNAASNNEVKMVLALIKIYAKHFDWKEIPLKIRMEQLASTHLGYARLVHKNDLKTAKQHSLKAFQINKSVKNASYFTGYYLWSLLG